jgi:hypothetical protein
LCKPFFGKPFEGIVAIENAEGSLKNVEGVVGGIDGRNERESLCGAMERKSATKEAGNRKGRTPLTLV